MDLIDRLLDLQIPSSIKISPNAQQLVYKTALTFNHKTGEHVVSTLWLAETGKLNSSRQLTSGLYNDGDPQWVPDGNSIVFVSDRAKPGGSSAIYVMPISRGGDAESVTPAEHEMPIQKLEISPGGTTIAFLSADEKTSEQKRRQQEKDDAQVWGEDWPFNRLRLVDIRSKTVTTLVAKASHIVDLAWNGDGTGLAFAETRTPDVESGLLYGTTISKVDVKSKEVTRVCHFPKTIHSLTTVGDFLYFIGPGAETKLASSYAVFHVNLSGGSIAYNKCSHGTEDCAMQLVKAGSDITVMVQHGMEDQIRILNGPTLFSRKKRCVAWDAAFTKDSDEVVLAIAQGDTDNPTEVYTTTASGGALVRLSNHGQAFANRRFGSCAFLTCQSEDGEVQLECPWITPAGHETSADDAKPQQPLPTVVLIHGGPYYRHTEAFDALYFMWSPLLLDAGYGILLVDYRGSSGRGEQYAAYASQGGQHAYEDIIALTQHAVVEGYADPQRLVVGGISYGGSQSYLCAVRNGTHGHGWSFKAAIPTAGVSDMDTMSFTSDIGAALSGSMVSATPWQLSRTDTRNRQTSAIWEFHDAIKSGVFIPPMLIMHGAEDKRVPLEQAVGMRRALENAALPFEMVSYPREGHATSERRHIADMGRRALRWVDQHIGGNKERPIS